ncbi:MAG: exopolygalacturonase, partial [Alistipes sp.]|nr:exopolygalacturonase [Alistipes sp.]
LVTDITGDAKRLLHIAPWRQFFDLQGRTDIPISTANDITMRNLDLDCEVFFAAQSSEHYILKDFHFEKLNIRATKNADYDKELIEGSTWKRVNVKLVEE